eukprot:TRINITY_DN6757_c0_g1_i1.p1 TRINITY_DN6757_c0_g1~~TRINITY_DN6757_c0_g1_i1.p1  ORF type:complete len:105 (+),score=0.93 TRINITY_DN6757_c0_g1_i1:226-540(+)
MWLPFAVLALVDNVTLCRASNVYLRPFNLHTWQLLHASKALMLLERSETSSAMVMCGEDMFFIWDDTNTYLFNTTRRFGASTKCASPPEEEDRAHKGECQSTND